MAKAAGMGGSSENPVKLVAIGGQRSPDALAWQATSWAHGVTAVTRAPFHHPIFII
jgi:hypothetical protein